jgi:pimeloyl-ACP methyl ester carboxylesterase
MAQKPTKSVALPQKLGRVATLTALGWLAYSRVAIDRDRPLPHALQAERRVARFNSPGKLSYYVDDTTSGTPLLLLHTINAAPSAMEIKPLFEHYRTQRPVYAPDLPGFGFSDRSDRVHSIDLYANTIEQFIAHEIGQPTDVIVLSLTSEFVARAAYTGDSSLFRSITMISPTGFMPAQVNIPDWLYGVFSFPLVGPPLFDLLTLKRVIRFYLNKGFVGDAPDELIEYAYATSHQPGAHRAPLYFVSGRLFTSDIRDAVYDKLHVPTLVLYDKDPNVSLEALPDFVEKHNTWHATRIEPSRGLPHWELLDETIEAIEAFWQQIEE